MLTDYQLEVMRSLKGDSRRQYKQMVYAAAYGSKGAARGLGLIESSVGIGKTFNMEFPLTPEECFPIMNYKLLLL